MEIYTSSGIAQVFALLLLTPHTAPTKKGCLYTFRQPLL
ncbi:hypothetical protein SAMN05192553_103290 [Cyclobacterium xiamenense]|uniref:Uncharacterized protein n=1 Tax=Cyclobacterium xiamenense TaxID=1297121 RepID=A0A1H6XVN2_9BACT|nr:hypothetical protein SAMN05192553_103290 [Cyclobacterium xiamenense]